MSWYLSPSLAVLRAEVDAAHPGRDRRSDGTIGDAAHSARESDHNPNDHGAVCALDVDRDGIDPWRLVAVAILDPRTNYVIFDETIWSRSRQWRPRRYTGPNPHTGHVHISILQAKWAEDDKSPWCYAPADKETTTMPTAREIAVEILNFPVQANGKTQPIIQHLATSFVQTAAQSTAVGAEAARDKQLAQAAADRDAKLLARLDEVLAEVRR